MDPCLFDHRRQRKRKMSIFTLSMNEDGGLSPIEKGKKEEKKERPEKEVKKKKEIRKKERKKERNLKE